MAKKAAEPMGLIDRLPAHGVLNKYPDREAWLAARQPACKGGHGQIGGSGAAALYDIGYRSTVELWAYHTGLDDAPHFDNGNMRRGRKLEPILLGELAEETGWQVEHWPQHWTVSDPDPTLRLTTTPDGLAVVTGDHRWSMPFDRGELIAVEIKTANEWAHKRWPRGAGGELLIPGHYEVQTQSTLRCLGIRRGVLFVLFGSDFDAVECIPYERHDGFQAAFAERLRWFWDLVESGERPPIDGSESTLQVLKRLYPVADGTICELPGDADLWAQQFEELGQQISKAEKERDVVKNRLIAAIGDSTWAQTPQGVAFSLKEQTRGGFDTDRLKGEFPEAYDACWEPERSRFRVLRKLSKLPREAYDAPEA